MRPIIKTLKLTAAGVPVEYIPHDEAKPDLCDEIGTFCSFCEKYNSRSALHVEHVFAKKAKNVAGQLIYDHLKFRWDNFLLACVNCNGVKGSKDIAVLNPYMPHENNLLCFIETITGGLIQIKAGVAGNDLIRTQAFIDLVGLDRVPGHPKYSDKDDRWDNRLEVFDIATRQEAKYVRPNPTTDIETIVDLARRTGYFSIWFNIFNSHNAVKNALLNGFVNQNAVLITPFPGTHVTSFDALNNYIPLRRP